jgi:hypothetical protein
MMNCDLTETVSMKTMTSAIKSMTGRRFSKSFFFQLLFLMTFLLSFTAHPETARAESFNESCGGDVVNWSIGGVKNLQLTYSDDSIHFDTLFCYRDYEADFPEPGSAVSYSMSVGSVVSSGDLHQFMTGSWYSRDYCPVPDEPPIPNCQSLQSYSTSECYSGYRFPFSLDLITSTIVSAMEDSDFMKTKGWLSVSLKSRQVYCTGSAEECRYTMLTKKKGAGT